MKKSIFFLTTLLLVAVFAFSATAMPVLYGVELYVPSVNGKRTSFIHSDYYKIYHNELLEHQYKVFCKNQSQISGTTDYTSLKEFIKDGYIYAEIILNEKPEDADYLSYNKEAVSKVFSEEDILYIGATTPVTVVKLTADDIDAVRSLENLRAITLAFTSTASLLNFMYGGSKMGDIDNNGTVSSSDARYVLRFAAGLEKVTARSAKNIYFLGDTDLDGHITAADARTVLRMSAQLEKIQTVNFDYAVYWNDFAE